MHQVITVGRRKTSVARVKVVQGSGNIVVNNRSIEEYFPLATLRQEVTDPLKVTNTTSKYDIFANVEGGGPTGQAGAVRLGIARALVKLDDDLRSLLRNAGLITRDPRMVERKKYGQKKARKRFQFSKR